MKQTTLTAMGATCILAINSLAVSDDQLAELLGIKAGRSPRAYKAKIYREASRLGIKRVAGNWPVGLWAEACGFQTVLVAEVGAGPDPK